MSIVHFAPATRDVRRPSRSFEVAPGWRPIDRPGNIAIASAWPEIAPRQEVRLLEIPDFEPSPFEREYGRHLAVSFPRSSFPWLKERLAQLGAEVFATERATPFARFFFRDPNGYVVEAERAPETRTRDALNWPVPPILRHLFSIAGT